MNLFTDVKTHINTQEAARQYGLEINRYGKALCPFHNDRHPSLYVADDHYYCYGCGEHGDVIDLTARLFGLSLYEAAKKLSYDFGISQDKPQQDIRRKKNEAQQLRENERLCFLRLTEYQRCLQEWKVRYSPCSPEDTPDQRYLEACHKLDYVEYLLEVLTSGTSHERNEVIQMLMTESKWKEDREDERRNVSDGQAL